MIEWLKIWANQVIVAVIIAVIFELIIPNGKNKKYIKMVINLYVLFVLINPIVSKCADTNILDLSKYNYKEYFNNSTSIETSSKLNSKDIIKDTYKKSIKDNIKNKLMSNGYNVSNISIDIDNSNENYGKINYIKLSVSKCEDAGDETSFYQEKNISSITINEIDKININASTNTIKENKKEILKKSEIEKVKKIISEEYNVSIDNIEIN